MKLPKQLLCVGETQWHNKMFGLIDALQSCINFCLLINATITLERGTFVERESFKIVSLKCSEEIFVFFLLKKGFYGNFFHNIIQIELEKAL